MAYRDMPVHEAKSAIARYRLIDVREADEFLGELGHIEGSELVPLATVSAASSSWDKTTPMLIICRSGNRSGRACEALVNAGFRDVSNLSGGMLAWRAIDKEAAS